MLLIYSESLNVIELSSASVSELIKVLELGIEFFKQAGQVKLKHGAFFFKYTSVASLQRENWTQICLSMKEQFEYDEKEIIQGMWSADSTLRKSLLDEYLPAHLADVLESEGIQSIGDIPQENFHTFFEELTTSQRINLNKIYKRLNHQSSIQKLKEREEIKKKSLREKIEKARAIVKQVEEAVETL